MNNDVLQVIGRSKRSWNRFFGGIVDALEVKLGLRDPLVAPKRLRFIGDGDYVQIGREFLGYFVDLCGLKPDERVLDIGCGIGRMAAPLAGYLSKQGSYHGVDIVAEGIEWCRKNITPRHPNFTFDRSDVYNKYYNPEGRFQPEEYRFPFADGSFDFVFLTSVFTHMLDAGMRNYLNEIGRILAPGGRCLITYFVMNDESMQLMRKPASAFNFATEHEGSRIARPDLPEYAVGHDESKLRTCYANAHLTIIDPIRWGKWPGRSDGMSFQDIIIARR
jgi:SAM-dependent methyltransferase